MKSEVIRHWLPCVAKNWNWSRTHATVKLESKIGNFQRKQNWTAKSTSLKLKKKVKKSSQFLSSEQPSEPNSLDVCLEYCRSWKLRSENLRLRSILEANRFKFWMKAALVTIGGNLRSLWMVILKSVWFIAGIQLAVSCNELNFLRCFSLKLTGTNRKTLSYVFI